MMPQGTRRYFEARLREFGVSDKAINDLDDTRIEKAFAWFVLRDDRREAEASIVKPIFDIDELPG